MEETHFTDGAGRLSGHGLTRLAATRACRIDRCNCGTLHLRIGDFHLKLSPDDFLQVAATIGIAAEPYLVYTTSRAN
jgi:hypothetical protein